MKDCDFTLELSDGTVVRVGSMGSSHHPDVKAYYLPQGTLAPFSQTNLPAARRGEERSEPAFAN